MAAKRKSPSNTSSAWGIIIGLTGIPVTALLLKVFPDGRIGWNALFAIFALVSLKSLFTYVFPRRDRNVAPETDHSHAH